MDFSELLGRDDDLRITHNTDLEIQCAEAFPSLECSWHLFENVLRRLWHTVDVLLRNLGDLTTHINISIMQNT